MAKRTTRYVCQSCGQSSQKWSGKCDGCGQWNTLVEEFVQPEVKGKGARRTASSTDPVPIGAIDADRDARIRTGLKEVDRVLGGGIVPGSMILLGGDPGIGKSTLMMQICHRLGGSSDAEGTILYISGEESLRQIKLRAERLNALSERFLVLAETNIDAILHAIETTHPALVVVDSIQTMYRPELESAPGSISQVRECAALLLQYAKSSNIPMFLIGHVTKDGIIAGPRVLEHMVDTVLQFEGDHHHAYRIVRGLKNRFGSTNEIGIFEMRENGLREVDNPSEVFLSERSRGISGSCVFASIEGTRALLVEVQALVSPSNFGMPQRAVSGIDGKRLSLLLAVLEKRYGLRTGQFDVFANIAGGVRIDEPAVDLSVAAAIVSSARDAAIHHSTVVIGEIGLGGEIRSVSHLEKRITEAEKLGFERVVVPKGNLKEKRKGQIAVVEVETIANAMERLVK
ncbi:MAG: DNA repair protein RadA [Ignavibacteria bacterium]|nr:DNA repair protein RadA [Ignavibacteria bacterium]